jgi:hypothetical protein
MCDVCCKCIEPLFPFGFGLSYTSFDYTNLQLSDSELLPGESLQISLDVTNTGERAGKEVVQLYVRDIESRLMRPPKELKGFQKIALKPGETKRVNFTLSADALSYYDDVRGRWIVEPGEFEVLVGHSSQDIRLSARFRLISPETKERKKEELSLETPLRYLAADEEARRILEKHFPGILSHPQIRMVLNLSLRQLASFVPQVFSEERLRALEKDLEALQRRRDRSH